MEPIIKGKGIGRGGQGEGGEGKREREGRGNGREERIGEGVCSRNFKLFWLCSFPNFDENVGDFCSPFPSFLNLIVAPGKKTKKADIILAF